MLPSSATASTTAKSSASAGAGTSSNLAGAGGVEISGVLVAVFAILSGFL